MASSSPHKYPYPSTLDPRGFVSIKLSKENYSKWKTQMLCFIQSQELDGFIDGTLTAPGETVAKEEPKKTVAKEEPKETVAKEEPKETVAKEEPKETVAKEEPKETVAKEGPKETVAKEEHLAWKRSDRLVKAWILGSLCEDVIGTIADSATARDVWTQLEEHLSPAPGKRENYWKYRPLYRAALKGEWEKAIDYFELDKDAIKAYISHRGETALHIAIGSTRGNIFVDKLVDRIPAEDLLYMQKKNGDTVLATAAYVGNTEAAKILVKKNPELLFIPNNDDILPLQRAALCGHRDMVLYLWSVTKYDFEPSPFRSELGATYLQYLIGSEFFDIALDFVEEEVQSPTNYITALEALLNVPLAFQSSCRLNFWETFIYSCVPVELERSKISHTNVGDIENSMKKSQLGESTRRPSRVTILATDLKLRLWDVVTLLVPHIGKIQRKKRAHDQALKLLRLLCKKIVNANDHDTYAYFLTQPMNHAAKEGIQEAVEEMVKYEPKSIWSRNDQSHYIFQSAVLNRHEKVFNLIKQMTGWKEIFISHVDNSENNILHLAGKLPPSHRLSQVSGAAPLQMQREIQWFKEVEKLVHPSARERTNSFHETPRMVFTREHTELVKEGMHWMKDTANSCTVTAALIVTIVFAAALTVPGGLNGTTGFPIFSENIFFAIFIVSDAISLFSSATSLLMFMGILTARYEEEDFHYSLPKRLILGLATMFISIITMMMAFSATIYLTVGKRETWFSFLVIVFACLPVGSYGMSQFPLLMEVVSLTYGRGIFRKQSELQFY